jgi:hypothetical protein
MDQQLAPLFLLPVRQSQRIGRVAIGLRAGKHCNPVSLAHWTLCDFL